MINLDKLIYNPFCKEIKEKASKLEQENLALKQQLILKQQHINDTNKYWKKKMHEVHRKVNKTMVRDSNGIAI